ncbi:large subunit ribosomal protein LP1 [Strigomonas culicis]|uniref:Large subunit ribosomal protein LP1 n=1 Tax=Strigomonas culicis TaxID=28005 RepID=S9WA15_9TRYP|nr:large subunit ribosomal protein LP1 [Strigomonas culicis]|eukprot:EPY32745.1 large subunit ribosomal protein LP1 [Strigomonas culicis]
MSTQQLACTYAALILSENHKSDAASLLAVTKAAGVDVSVGMAHAFSAALATVGVESALKNISFGAGAAPAGGAAPVAASSGAAAPAAAAAKEEAPEEDDDEMGFGLFD